MVSPYPPVPVSPGAPTYRSPPWCTMAQPSMVPVSGLGPASCTIVPPSRVKLVTSTGSTRRVRCRGQDIATVMIGIGGVSLYCNSTETLHGLVPRNWLLTAVTLTRTLISNLIMIQMKLFLK